MNTSPIPPKRRLGCFTSLLLSLGFGCLVVLAVIAITAPWAFFMGGHFHPLANWEGWGRLHSGTAGDYVLFVNMQPGRGSRGIPHVKGTAVLCTPKGEKFNLTLGGDFERHLGLDTDGKSAYLYMYNRHVFSGDTRPRFDLHGAWHNPDLVMSDRGSLSRDFDPDGTFYTGRAPTRHPTGEVLSITLKEGNKSDFDAACAAAGHH